jgi:hypothetical protein
VHLFTASPVVKTLAARISFGWGEEVEVAVAVAMLGFGRDHGLELVVDGLANELVAPPRSSR